MQRRRVGESLPADVGPGLRAVVLAFGLASVAAPALSSEGVHEINQTCAVLTGCFPGDAAGFPVRIDDSGSYRLTSNLSVPDANTGAIYIPGSSVDLDLGGFTISGVTSCSSVPVSGCSPSGSGVGVDAGSDVRVHDGEVRGMGAEGIRLGFSGRVERVHASHNAASGIRIGGPGVARDNLVVSNGGDGIQADIEAQLFGNASVGNKLAGIRALSGVAVNNGASRNGGAGGDFGAGVAFSGNSFANDSGGSRAGGAATGGNFCDDGKCTRDGARRYYLSLTGVQGNQPLLACAAGFHMASLPELNSGSTMHYDDSLASRSGLDGSGPPTQIYGWVRTVGGSDGGTVNGNCLLWTTALDTSAGRIIAWGGAATGVGLQPWIAQPSVCDTHHPVWCVED